MTELQLEILFGGMGYDVQNVRIVEDLRTGANKGWVGVEDCSEDSRFVGKSGKFFYSESIPLSLTIDSNLTPPSMDTSERNSNPTPPPIPKNN